MNYRISEGIKKNKKVIIIGLVLWLILTIVLVLPYTAASKASVGENGIDLTKFFDIFTQLITQPAKSIEYISSKNLISDFMQNEFVITIIYLIVFIVGFVRTMPKHQYDNIEHGSSDWCEHGEQYKILSNKKGIILSEGNYLPVDKRGNVNVLVVGGSGSGKSASYSIPNAYQLLGSYVFTDPKGELYDRTAGYMKANGYKIKVLNLVHQE